MATSFLTDVRDTLVPHQTDEYGPLPLLLVGMTVLTGLVDAFSYLVLGHVFVANMTGNVVFLAFALAGAKAFSIAASLVALASFSGGALVGGMVTSRFRTNRGTTLFCTATLQCCLLAASVVISALSSTPLDAAVHYSLIVVLGLAMGMQNATARKLAVPDLTTTVLTLTVTGISADSTLAGGHGSKAGRRLISVVAMLVGALVGAALALHVNGTYPVVVALAIALVIVSATRWLARSAPAWTRPPGN